MNNTIAWGITAFLIVTITMDISAFALIKINDRAYEQNGNKPRKGRVIDKYESNESHPSSTSMSSKYPPPAHPLSRSQCDPELLVGGGVACERPYPSWTARPHLHLLGRLK